LKQDITEWLINTGFMTIGYYCRIIFGADKLNWKQMIALYAFGIAVVFIVNLVNIETVYKLSIVMAIGLVLPNVVRVIIKSGNKSEDKAAKNISKQVDKFTK